MKNKIIFYGLFVSLLISTVIIYPSDQHCKTHAKQIKMNKLRQYNKEESNAIKNEIKEAKNRTQGAAQYFSNIKFEKALQDAKAINSYKK